ncbi:hypothetical protein AVEN_66431-1 [Araneus ventricosus]|uniref:Uncharacterized protein n=1 Tax=Araneus ventricosus TaxID=182803 RepID=A0A4Y2EIN7_ARAVE|nr:hypothetical protein AVEN_66431-1 [Araneus ventricosus]
MGPLNSHRTIIMPQKGAENLINYTAASHPRQVSPWRNLLFDKSFKFKCCQSGTVYILGGWEGGILTFALADSSQFQKMVCSKVTSKQEIYSGQ